MGFYHCFYITETQAKAFYIVNVSGMSPVEAFKYPFNGTDVTGDDFVDASDLSIVDNNVANGVIVIAP